MDRNCIMQPFYACTKPVFAAYMQFPAVFVMEKSMETLKMVRKKRCNMSIVCMHAVSKKNISLSKGPASGPSSWSQFYAAEPFSKFHFVTIIGSIDFFQILSSHKLILDKVDPCPFSKS